ncbi:hypothetical protein Acr_00g0080250 [Actinidia rufa]|uniref:Integrase zinc-binding domain-containing protein n=1 Tax=Actinidia rufa TaxID=165716 RepID=A0A7J0DVU7_9ERIC|nr:hypothetical protein Acr_00g0080250 [Actinidia rufa]
MESLEMEILSTLPRPRARRRQYFNSDQLMSILMVALASSVETAWQWMEYIKDYDFDLQYHPRKANVVADALSRKVLGKLAKVASLTIREWKMMGEIGEFVIDLMDSTGCATLYGLVAQPTLVNQIIKAQSIDEEAEAIRAKLVMGEEQPGWELLREFHHSCLAVHSGGTKMYHDLRRQFWWKEMKHDVAEFVLHCLTCQQVKAKHQRAARMLQPLPVVEWKWEYVTIDFVRRLPKSLRGHDAHRGGEVSIIGPDMMRETTEKIKTIRQRLLTIQSRQKSYVDKRRRHLSFEVDDHVFLKVSPRRGLKRFGRGGKLSSRYIGPFDIISKIGGEWRDLELEADVSYVERPIRILDTLEHVLRGRAIPIVKVLWTHHGSDEATWEKEDQVQAKYPELFRS